MRIKSLIAVVTLAVVLSASTGTALGSSPASASPGSSLPSRSGASFRVGVLDYTLGEKAFSYPGLQDLDLEHRQPIELTGRVYYPIERTRRQHPMVVLLHGLWPTCADRQAQRAQQKVSAAEEKWASAHPSTREHPGAPNPDQTRLDAISDAATSKLFRWPCARGTAALPSYRGFGYLAHELAAHGITVVSISANGINASGTLGTTPVKARAALVNKHLALWAQLERTGGGPLAGHFTRPGTTRPAAADFRHRLNLSDVGVLGHSRGGKAVFWQAADKHRRDWPAGVTVRAMVSLAPEGGDDDAGTPDEANYLVSRLPFLTWVGTCDGATHTQGLDYIAENAFRNRHTDYLLTVHGANHNFLNKQWSPSSRQVAAEDDAQSEPVDGVAPVPGRCTETSPALPLDLPAESTVSGAPNAQRELTERSERRIAVEYITAFFLKELDGQKRWDALLSGRDQPLRRLARTNQTVLSHEHRPAGR